MRHRWNVTDYATKYRACIRPGCGVTSRTYGVGAHRVWSYTDRDGRFLGYRAPDCTPQPAEEQPA